MSEEIVISHMLRGSHADSKLGHDRINLFESDKRGCWLYLNDDGTIPATHKDKIKKMVLVRSTTDSGYVEVIGVASGLFDVSSNAQFQDLLKKNVTYDGTTLEDIYINNPPQPVYITFGAEKVLMPDKRTFIVFKDGVAPSDNGNDIDVINLVCNQKSDNLYFEDGTPDYKTLIDNLFTNFQGTPVLKINLLKGTVLPRYDEQKDFLKRVRNVQKGILIDPITPTEEDGPEIVINYMFGNNFPFPYRKLRHDVINLFESDKLGYFLYLNPDGTFAPWHNGRIKQMILVGPTSYSGCLKVIGIANGLTDIPLEEQIAWVHDVFYGGVKLANIFTDNPHYVVFITFRAETVLRPEKPTYLFFGGRKTCPVKAKNANIIRLDGNIKKQYIEAGDPDYQKLQDNLFSNFQGSPFPKLSDIRELYELYQ